MPLWSAPKDRIGALPDVDRRLPAPSEPARRAFRPFGASGHRCRTEAGWSTEGEGRGSFSGGVLGVCGGSGVADWGRRGPLGERLPEGHRGRDGGGDRGARRLGGVRAYGGGLQRGGLRRGLVRPDLRRPGLLRRRPSGEPEGQRPQTLRGPARGCLGDGDHHRRPDGRYPRVGGDRGEPHRGRVGERRDGRRRLFEQRPRRPLRRRRHEEVGPLRLLHPRALGRGGGRLGAGRPFRLPLTSPAPRAA